MMPHFIDHDVPIKNWAGNNVEDFPREKWEKVGWEDLEVGVRAQRALRERDQGPRQDVGALDGDTDGNHLVGRLQIVGGTVADRAAAVNVHGVVDGAAQALGRLVLHQSGNDRGLLAAADHGGRDARAASLT